MEITITSALPGEEDLYELYQVLGWNQFLKLDSTTLMRAMSESYYSVYTYSGEILVATGRVISDSITNAYISGVGVHNDYRHQGIATRIIEQLVDHCRKANLHIQLFCEEDMIHFYEKLGFSKFALGMKSVEEKPID